MTASDRLLVLLKVFEGLRLKPYRDAGGYWTVGWGHKLGPDEIPVTITRDQAMAYLLTDLARIEKAVGEITHGLELNQNQFDALVSLAFNIGPAALAGSTLVMLLRKGDVVGAAQQFTKWSKIHGKTNLALMARRIQEQKLFLEPAARLA